MRFSQLFAGHSVDLVTSSCVVADCNQLNTPQCLQCKCGKVKLCIFLPPHLLSCCVHMSHDHRLHI